VEIICFVHLPLSQSDGQRRSCVVISCVHHCDDVGRSPDKSVVSSCIHTVSSLLPLISTCHLHLARRPTTYMGRNVTGAGSRRGPVGN